MLLPDLVEADRHAAGEAAVTPLLSIAPFHFRKTYTLSGFLYLVESHPANTPDLVEKS